MNEKGLVSLLLTTYNSESVIRTTLDSIMMQDYPNIEICIADCCSTDSTMSIIEEYKNNSKYRIICESKKDSGIYDGLNNAIGLSTGMYLQVMNDRLMSSDAITRLVDAIHAEENGSKNPDLVLGAHSDLIYAEGDKIIRYWHMGRGNIKYGWMPAHPTLMLKRSVYEKYGLYDTSYICSADYEFVIRIMADGGTLGYVPDVLISMYYGGTSNMTMGSYFTSVIESLKALNKNRVHPALIITAFRTIRVIMQFLRR